jgi:hypothetical protein
MQDTESRTERRTSFKAVQDVSRNSSFIIVNGKTLLGYVISEL